MAKLSQLDKAIAALEAERAVIDAALAMLRQQQEKKPARAQKKLSPPPRVDRVVGGTNLRAHATLAEATEAALTGFAQTGLSRGAP